MNGAVRKLLALAITLAVAHLAPSLRAEGAQIVEFSASEPGCPEPGFVNARFWQLVGEGVESSGRAVITLTKTQAAGYEFLIRITNDNQTGERRFSASSCRLGAETAALIIAISLFPERANDLEQRSQDLSAKTRSNEPQPTRSADVDPRTSTMSGSDDLRVAVPARPVSPADARHEIHGTLSLSSGLDTTSMPYPAIGFAAVTSLEFDRVSIELSGSRFVSQTVRLPEQRGSHFALMALGGHACYSFLGRQAVTLSSCLGATVVRVAGRGFGAQRTFERVGVFGGPAVGAAMRWHVLELLNVRIYAESLVYFARPRFVLENQLVHQPAAIGLSVFVGPELRF